MQLTIIAAIFVAIAGVVFALQNNVPVTVNYLPWQFNSSLAMVIMLSVAVGAIILALLTTPGTVRRQWQMARQKRQIEDLEQERELLQARVAELEPELPAPSKAAEPLTAYVGLKQIAASMGSSPADEHRRGA